MAKYGKEINRLMGPEDATKYLATLVVLGQLVLGLFVVQRLTWGWYLFIAYAVGGTLTHNLFLAIHEVTHNLAFRGAYWNDMYAMVLNIPLAVPYAMMFKTYHAEHHKYQGWDGIDTDIAAFDEAVLMNSFFGKLFFLVFQILFYAFRPMFVRPVKIQPLHIANYAVVGAAQVFFFYHFGYSPLMYWLLSAFFACSLHPMAGHFLAEHYVFNPKTRQETYSYYGPLNLLGWNVGYHNEHHDFPNVPWSRLAALKKLAPEFYDNLDTVDSWPGTLFRFLFDSKMNTFCRVKREKGAWGRGDLLPTSPKTPKPASSSSSFQKD